MCKGKPGYLGEFGMATPDAPNDFATIDPTGNNLVNEQWASLMTKGAGGGFTWYGIKCLRQISTN